MTVQQVYTLLNGISKEILGESAVVNEDLSNVVDIGKSILSTVDVDNYVKTLVDRIGKVVFVNRPYSGSAPSVMMDSWQYGSVLQKIDAELPDAVENQDWELTDGHTYDPNVFHKPTVGNKFFNSKVTFEVDLSITEKQVKESFTSASDLAAFLSMIETAVQNSMTIKIDGLIMRTITNFIALTAAHKSALQYVNLLAMYNTQFGTTLTASKAMTTPEFIRFASMQIGLVQDRMSKMSTLFNIGGKTKFTAKDKLHTVMLSDFQKAAGVYLQSDTYNEKYVSLPNAESVPYWQGSGVAYDFTSISSINVQATGQAEATTATGIICTMFDSDALGVCNTDRRVSTNYNPKGEFFNNFYKFDASYFNDTNENFVVFYVA